MDFIWIFVDRKVHICVLHRIHRDSLILLWYCHLSLDLCMSHQLATSIHSVEKQQNVDEWKTASMVRAKGATEAEIFLSIFIQKKPKVN